MKKFISLLLCILTVFTSLIITASASENDLSVTVVNDLHYNLRDSSAQKVSKRNSISTEYAHASSSGQLPYESVAIIKSFLEDAAKNDNNIILMPGDLTTVGTIEEHNAFISLIKNFEETTGKRIYVIPGNHDLFKTTVAEFKNLYADFGYGEAIANDPNTASYVAELENGYRLLAIDSTIPGDSPHGVNNNLINWVKEQCDAAKRDNKKLIAIMHHNLIEHTIFMDLFHSGAVVTSENKALADTLADGSVKYIFTAHTHAQDIAMYTSPNGNILYDCVTTSLNAYPCAYRTVNFGEQVKIETKYVQAIDTTLLPEGIHENALALANSDFLEYAKNCTYTGIKAAITAYTKPATLKKYITTDDTDLQAIIDPVIDKVCETLALPLYKANETEEGKSIERMAEKLDTKLPATEYKTMIDLAVKLYQAHAEGDENYPAYTNEMIVLQRSLAVVLNYALNDLTTKDYVKVLNFATNLLGINLSDDILNTVGGTLEKFKGNELLLTAALMPVLVEFTVDDAPADNNVTLSGYGITETKEESFLDQLKDFFKKIFDFLYSLFVMIV